MENSTLPPGWSWTDLGSLTSEVQPGFKCGKRDTKGFVQLRTNNIGLSGAVVQDSVLRVPRSLTNVTKYRLQKGDVLFNNTNTPKLVGKTALFTGEIRDCVYSNHITRLRVIEGLAEPSWLAWLLVLQQQVGTFERICHRSVSQATVSGTDLLRLRVPLPPFAEQLRIAARVVELLGELGTTRQTLEEVHSSMEGLRRSLIAAACRGDLTERDLDQVPARRILERVRDERQKRRDEGGHRKGGLFSDETDALLPIDGEAVRGVPDSWPIVGLGALVELRRGRAVKHHSGIGDIPVYGGNGCVGRQSEHLLERSTLVIGRVGSNCGNVHLTPGPAWVTDNALFASWVNPAISLEYLALLLEQRHINELSGGTGQPYVSKDLLRCLPIPVPSLMEQKRIVQKVNQLLAVSKKVEDAIGRGIGRPFGLERAILTKAFRGQLVLQDPDDEPASALLGRLGTERACQTQMGEMNHGRK